jgi:uncharacterized membrane protein YfcA
MQALPPPTPTGHSQGDVSQVPSPLRPPEEPQAAKASTTSNFMIGVTAAASAGIYFSRGDIPPLIAAPVALGILIGALVGARLLARLSNRILRIVFLAVIVVAAVEMMLRGLGIA